MKTGSKPWWRHFVAALTLVAMVGASVAFALGLKWLFGPTWSWIALAAVFTVGYATIKWADDRQRRRQP